MAGIHHFTLYLLSCAIFVGKFSKLHSIRCKHDLIPEHTSLVDDTCSFNGHWRNQIAGKKYTAMACFCDSVILQKLGIFVIVSHC